MKKILITFLVVVTFFIYIPASISSDIEKNIEKGKKSTAFIVAAFTDESSNNQFVQTGTGFIIDTKKSPGLIIVTNRHILEHKKGGKSILPREIKVKIYKLSDVEPTLCDAELISLHDSYDLALLLIKLPKLLPQDVKLRTSPDGKPYYGIRATSFLLEDDILPESETKEGVEVYYSGYPKGLGIEGVENHPVTRKGIIAQAVSERGEIMIDGFVSPGNSGSPVYCVNGNSPKLVGIQIGFLPDSTIGYDESGNIISVSSYNSGLSIVIRASVIRDFVYDLINSGKYKGQWSK